MVGCSVFGCPSRSSRVSGRLREKRRFFTIPAVIESGCKRTVELSIKRRALWLARINRADINESSKHNRVCSEHFLSGKPAYHMDEANPDWAPCINLGYKTPQKVSNQRYERQKRRNETKMLIQISTNFVELQNSLSAERDNAVKYTGHEDNIVKE